jgi:Transglycosylase SLT domain
LIACQMLPSFGLPRSQMPALVALWNGESGWRVTATNPHSGAYGIPQSLPAGKMARAGRDWRTNPTTQIRWGLGYIKATYGTPARALAAWRARSPHWY